MREDDIKQFLDGVKELCSKHNVFVRMTVNIPEQYEPVVDNAQVTKDDIWINSGEVHIEDHHKRQMQKNKEAQEFLRGKLDSKNNR